MFEALVAVFHITVICNMEFVEGRHSIGYVLVPLSPETAMHLGLKSNGSEIFIPCSYCFFKFDRPRNKLIQYYDRPLFGETLQPCGCFEYMKKVFVNFKGLAPITVSGNVIQIDVGVYYGVIKTDRCRLDSIKAVRTVKGFQLALLIRCQ